VILTAARTIRLTTADHVCTLRIAKTIAELLPLLHRQVSGPTVWVTEETVYRNVWPVLEAARRRDAALRDPIRLRAGETTKTLRTLESLHREFLRRGLDRQSTVIAVGGGMLTDLAGFAAATWMRGIEWVAIPTTLLGMVDASIGGKVAVNLARVKNLVGAFHQPRAVLMATQFLRTLPDRERRSGLGEVVKYGMIADARLFRDLEKQGSRLQRPHPVTDARIVARCARIKAHVVQEDERESGVRAMLNFGHTIGHVLEARSRYRMPHGEAVGLGMLAACRIAELSGVSDAAPRRRLTALLRAWGMPVHAPSRLTWQGIWTALGRDKKSLHGSPRFVLTPEIGRVRTGCAVDPVVVQQALRVLEARSPVR